MEGMIFSGKEDVTDPSGANTITRYYGIGGQRVANYDSKSISLPAPMVARYRAGAIISYYMNYYGLQGFQRGGTYIP